MTKQHGYINFGAVALVLCVVLVIASIAATAAKQEADREKFMGACLQDKKQYECDVLWAQTGESKQTRDLAIAIGAGLAIGLAAGGK